VFLNTYEVVFNRDIPGANSVKKVTAQDQVWAIIDQFDIQPEAGWKSNHAGYKKLEYLQVPSISTNLYLEEKRIIDNSWYTRLNMGHYLGLNKDERNITVDYLIYVISSWRTIPQPNEIEKGVDINLFHDGRKVSAFKVEEKEILPLHTTFVASKSENRQIILLIEVPDEEVYYAYSLVLKD
jgi:hypothetical protein